MSTFKTRDGVSIVYEVEGVGEPLVMLHGMHSNLQSFQAVAEALKDHFTVITYDMRGHGLSGKPLNYTIDDHIGDVAELIQHLGHKKVHLLGHSMGAYIALGFAVHHAAQVDKLILVGAKSHAEVSSFAKLMMKHRSEVKGKTKEEVEEVLNPYIYYDTEKVKEWKNDVRHYMALTDNEEAIAARGGAGFDYRGQIKEIPNDILLVTGIYDGLNPTKESEIIAEEVQHGKMVIFEKSGHAPHVEEPERFTQEVCTFLHA